jgi:uncharacterized membrane protein
MRGSRTGITNLTLSLATALLGIYAGAQLTEGAVLVPHWRSLPASEFLAWYAANDARLLGFFGPLTTATVLVAVAAAVMAAWAGHPGRWPAATAATLMLVALAMFVVYFERTNASFAAATISSADVPAELARWATWHWTRTVISLAALAAAFLSLWRSFGSE